MTFDIYIDMPWHLTFNIWHMIFNIWHLTSDIWHLVWWYWHWYWRYWQHSHWHLRYRHNPITFSMMNSEVICNPKKSTHSLTHWLNNIGLRDASASKNQLFQLPHIAETVNLAVWAISLILLYDFTLFVIDMHPIMLISLCSTSFDHLHFHGFLKSKRMVLLKSCHIDIDIDIFKSDLIDIDIDINIFNFSISISISISIFFKSVDISTIDNRYRYIEQG